MNCANHTDVAATAYCRTCGKPLCSSCVRDIRGVIYCEECLASHVSGTVPPPGTPAVPSGTPHGVPNPRLAALLGFIPGVGAMYNGEYAKGFIHVLILGTLIWLTANLESMQPLFGLAIAAFVIYMPIEAYKTARAKEMGLPPPDPFGFNNLFSSGSSAKPAQNIVPGVVPAGTTAAASPQGQPAELEAAEPSRVPIGAFILIGLGLLFLLNTLNLFRIDFLLHRFWPLILIAVGVRVLMKRQRGW